MRRNATLVTLRVEGLLAVTKHTHVGNIFRNSNFFYEKFDVLRLR